MQLEQERNQRMREAYEASISSLEAQIEKTRARLEEERAILTKHESAFRRKKERGTEIGVSGARFDRKQVMVRTIEGRLADMARLLEAQRERVRRVLEFRPIQSQLEQVPEGFRRAGNGEWKIPNSRFRTFQDIFTPVEARIIPDGRTVSRQDYDRMLLDHCPVDPERVPDWFFEEFGLGDLGGLDPLERLERKAGRLQEVRAFFGHLHPLKAYGRETHRVFCVNGHSKKHDGKLLVTSYSGREGDERDRKIMQFFGSAYEAHRRTAHIDSGYQAEQEKIHGIRGRVRDIQRSLVGMRRDDPKIEDIQKRLASEVEILGHVTNTFKVQSADILRDVMDIKDSLDRHNPGATCARLVRALGLLEKRLPQIFEKSPWIADDRRILSAEINQGKEVLDSHYRGYLGLCRGLQSGETCGDAGRRLDLLPALDGLSLRPFNLYAAKLREKSGAIKKAIGSDDWQSTRDQAIRAYVACKVFEVQHERERVLRDIVESPIGTSIESLLRRAAHLKSVVMSKETFPGVRLGFNEAYTDMAIKLVTLVDRLTHYSRQTLSESERLAMYERLKKFLEEIEFTEVLEIL